MALSAAIQQAALYLDVMALEIVRLRDLFESRVKGLSFYKNSFRLPNTTAIAFEKVDPEALLYFLNRKGVYASMDKRGLSFSLSRMTTEEEILKASTIVNETVLQLQAMSEDL